MLPEYGIRTQYSQFDTVKKVNDGAMTWEILSALAAFAFASSITPGPNNLMLMASGANFGFWRTIPHMMGVAVGFTIMIVLVGAGLAQIFEAFPVAHTILKVVSVLYLSWLAWKIAHASAPEGGGRAGTPMTFPQAAAFQWINPKAWAMALTAVAVYSWGQGIGVILVIAAIFGGINLPCVSSWTLLGQQMQRVLSNPARLRAFNWTMAGLLIASVLPVIVP